MAPAKTTARDPERLLWRVTLVLHAAQPCFSSRSQRYNPSEGYDGDGSHDQIVGVWLTFQNPEVKRRLGEARCSGHGGQGRSAQFA